MTLLERMKEKMPYLLYGNTKLYFDSDSEGALSRVLLIEEQDRVSYLIEDGDGKKPSFKIVTESENGARVECPTSIEDTWVIPVLYLLHDAQRISCESDNLSEAAKLMSKIIYMITDYNELIKEENSGRDFSDEVVSVYAGNAAKELFLLPYRVPTGVKGCDGKQSTGIIVGEAYRFSPLGVRTKKGTLFQDVKWL